MFQIRIFNHYNEFTYVANRIKLIEFLSNKDNKKEIISKFCSILEGIPYQSYWRTDQTDYDKNPDFFLFTEEQADFWIDSFTNSYDREWFNPKKVKIKC